MARTRKKAKTLWWAVSRLFFILLLLSMLAAYISNQVTISSKQAELDALNEQIAQQQSENEELERILSGDPDEIVEHSSMECKRMQRSRWGFLVE